MRFRQATPDPWPFTELHRLELKNAFGLAVFRKQITVATAQAAWTNVEADLQAGVLVVSAVLWSDVFRETEKLARLHPPASGSRSLDTLHIAAALVLRTVDFVTFDIREAALAKLTGLNVRP